MTRKPAKIGASVRASVINRIKPMVKVHEGFRRKPYRCTAKKLTIGYGHNIEDMGVSESIAEMMLEEDLAIAFADASDVIGDDKFFMLPLSVQGAMTDMAFNLGKSRFSKFKKMIAALRSYDYALAAEEMLNSRWANQVGQRAVDLAQIVRTQKI